jgi:hypothetical protein
VSDYNVFHERLLDLDLGVEEYRLAIALGRSLLGFRKRAEYLGQDLLRDTARLIDGRSFERARDGLVEKGLLAYTSPGKSPGRGARGHYELLLGDEEVTAPERSLLTGESHRTNHRRSHRTNHGSGAVTNREKRTERYNNNSKTPTNGDVPDDLAAKALAAFNKQSKGKYADPKYLRQIEARISEYPDLSLHDHVRIIRANFLRPWWKDTPSPSVLYGSRRAFEKALTTDAGVRLRITPESEWDE